MNNIKVTVIPSLTSEIKIKVGDILRMVKEPENPYDSKAVALQVDNEILGHIAASEDTIQPNTTAAKDMFKKLGSKKLAEAWVKITESITIQQPSSSKAIPGFIGECNFIPVVEKETKQQTTEVIIGGAFVKNPMIAETITEIIEAKANGTAMPTYMVRTDADGNKLIVVKNMAEEYTSSRGEVLNPPVDLVTSVNRDGNVIVQAIDVCDQEGKPLKDDEGVTKAYVKKCYKVSYNLEDGTPPKITEEIKRAVREGRGKYSELEEKVDFMTAQAVPFNVISAVLGRINTCPDEFESDIPHPETLFSQTESLGELTRVLAYRVSGMHLRLIGNKGSGKNTLAETVDWIFGCPQYRLQGNAEMDKLDLLGSPSLHAGTMTYEISDMLRFLEIGGDIVLDEGNTIKPEVAALLHSLTDNARQIQVPGYGLVKMHPESTITITMNEDYCGTTRMNEATIDRFTPIQMSQPSSIKALLQKCCPDATTQEVSICDKVYLAIKNKIVGENSNGTLDPDCMTIRGFIDALKVSSLLGLKTALLDNVAKKPQDAYCRMELCEVIASLVK